MSDDKTSFEPTAGAYITALGVATTSSDERRDSVAGDLLELFERRPAWHKVAACRGMFANGGDNIFFSDHILDQQEAKKICETCPAFSRCKKWADSQQDIIGIHAGQWYGRQPPVKRGVKTQIGRQIIKILEKSDYPLTMQEIRSQLLYPYTGNEVTDALRRNPRIEKVTSDRIVYGTNSLGREYPITSFFQLIR